MLAGMFHGGCREPDVHDGQTCTYRCSKSMFSFGPSEYAHPETSECKCRSVWGDGLQCHFEGARPQCRTSLAGYLFYAALILVALLCCFGCVWVLSMKASSSESSDDEDADSDSSGQQKKHTK